LCALEISKELKNHPELRVRMGIHSGPVNEITDLNEQANIAGAGINMAQRVMDCGDAGHILLSRHVAEDLEHYPRWQPYLHDLGECEVKHGARVHLVNLYTDELGNSKLPRNFTQISNRNDAIPRQNFSFFLSTPMTPHWSMNIWATGSPRASSTSYRSCLSSMSSLAAPHSVIGSVGPIFRNWVASWNWTQFSPAT
jgi:Adenylate and Guanylate cyclase catalytic domain